MNRAYRALVDCEEERDKYKKALEKIRRECEGFLLLGFIADIVDDALEDEEEDGNSG